MSRSYYRAFLPIKQERSDYSLSGREALGKAIIEAKGNAGKISVAVQDVKPNNKFEVCLIANVSNEYIGVNIGKIFIDERGKGVCKQEFDADDVNKSGIEIESFTITALISPKEGELIVPFVGYKNESAAWKVNFKYFTEIKPPEVAVAEVEEAAEDVTIEAAEEAIIAEEKPEFADVPTEEPIAAEEAAEDRKTEATEEESVETTEAEESVIEEEQKADINPHEKFKEIARKFSEKLEELKPVDKQESEPIDEEIEKLFETNTVMYPFQQRKSDVTWVRISPRNLLKLPPEFNRHANCPLVLNGFRSFKHLIFGKCCQHGVTKFLLGVPDIYYEHKKQPASDHGFLKFECCDGGEIFNGAYGYWVIVI